MFNLGKCLSIRHLYQCLGNMQRMEASRSRWCYDIKEEIVELAQADMGKICNSKFSIWMLYVKTRKTGKKEKKVKIRGGF